MEERNDYQPFEMKHFYGVVVFSIILLIILISYNSKSVHYVLSPKESLDHITNNANMLQATKMAEIIYSKDSLYQIVDLRKPNEFKSGHIEGSMNIPVGRIFDEKYLPILNQDEKITILVGKSSSESVIAYMMLNDEGYANLRVVPFGVDFVLSNIIEKYAPLSGRYDEERTIYNYSKIISETGGVAIDAGSSNQVTKKKAPVKKKKKAVEEEGGC